MALRTVVDALGGMAKLAEKTGLSRETLYRTLSSNGNPRLDTLAAILAAFGLTLSVQAITPPRAARRKSVTSAAAKSSRPRPPRANAR
jgi:DNA-binding phage protein